MSNPKYLPRIARAIGASYLFEQTAGCERIGGLEVSIKVLLPVKGSPEKTTLPSSTTAEPKASASGRQIRIKNTFYRTEEVWEGIDSIKQAAVTGIVDYADEHTIDLNQLDIEIGSFLYHPVDSRERVYYRAAQIAFRTALDMLMARKREV